MLCDLRKAGHHSGPLRFLTSCQSSVNASEEKGMAVDHMTANVQRSPPVPQRCRAAGMKGRWREGMVLLPTPTSTLQKLPASRGHPPPHHTAQRRRSPGPQEVTQPGAHRELFLCKHLAPLLVGTGSAPFWEKPRKESRRDHSAPERMAHFSSPLGLLSSVLNSWGAGFRLLYVPVQALRQHIPPLSVLLPDSSNRGIKGNNLEASRMMFLFVKT